MLLKGKAVLVKDAKTWMPLDVKAASVIFFYEKSKHVISSLFSVHPLVQNVAVSRKIRDSIKAHFQFYCA